MTDRPVDGSDAPAATGAKLVVPRHLRIEASLDRLAEVRGFVRDVAQAAAAPVDCLDDLVQAVDEVATNVVVHGYQGSPGWLDIEAAVVGDDIVVSVSDAAPPFDPTSVPEPDLTIPPLARRPGGMGVHLARMATDHLAYRPRPGGGNILTMVRARTPGEKEGR